tara:strand:- start:7328 stop:7948 length:621 start_codon:yes stop_codon:yes gene_type:complete
MTITPIELLFYAGGLFILFLTPGPVWVALLARAMSGGFHSAWPLALGVVAGDIIWPLIAILSLTWIVDQASWFMDFFRWVAVVMFIAMGVLMIWHADRELSENTSLTRPGMWSGFTIGVVVIISNPKAVLFYMGVLPGFFDLTRVTWPDIVVICIVGFLVPLLGNLALAFFVDRVRSLLKAPGTIRRINLFSGWLLVGVGALISVN